MADSCPSAIWVTDAEGDMQFVNRTYLEFCGIAYDQAAGKKSQLVVHPQTAPKYLGAFQRAVEKHAPFKAEACARHADGEWRWVESFAEPRFASSGEFLGHVGLMLDITERKQSDAKLQLAREHSARLQEKVLCLELEKTTDMHRLILSAAGEGIYGLDLDGLTTFANPAALAMLGYSEEELIGKPQHATIHHSYADGSVYPRESCLIYKALNDGQVHRCDTEVFWKKDIASLSYSASVSASSERSDRAARRSSRHTTSHPARTPSMPATGYC